MTRSTATNTDLAHMQAALGLARQALARGEFPVGCVIAASQRILATGRRTGTTAGSVNELDHAEMNALRMLSASTAAADRSQMTIYCTMEPCLMCFAAILLAGIRRIVYAYEDVMGGGTGCDRRAMAPLYRDAEPVVVAGVLRGESLALFQRFFTDSGNTYWTDSLLSRYTLDQPVKA
jgi:tRNA(adenine34) deaminase